MADLVDRVAKTKLEWLDDVEADAKTWDTISSTPQRLEVGKTHYRVLARRIKRNEVG
jgi:hypothetical protein